MQQFRSQVFSIIILILIESLVAQHNKTSVIHSDIPIDLTVDNRYSKSDYQFPNSEWEAVEAINPIWIHFPASTRHRQIVACTCTTEIDTIIGIYYYYENRTVGYLNDDRTDENLSNRCFLLSSFVSLFIPKDKDFYVVVASFNSTNNVGSIDVNVYQDYENIFPTQVIINAIHAENQRLTARINEVYDAYLSLESEISSDLEGARGNALPQFDELNNSLLAAGDSIFAKIGEFEDEIGSTISSLSSALEMQSLIAATEAFNNLMDQIRGGLDIIQSKFLSIHATTVQLSDLNLSLNVNYQNLDFTQRFNAVDASISSIHRDTDYLQVQLSDVQLISENNNDFLKNQIFAKYLLAKDSESRKEIPSRYLTPSKYLGNMDDILNFVVALYNEKVAYCSGNSYSAGCKWFTKNTKGEYNLLMNTYQSSVAENKFMKAFEALQRFYEKLYPTTDLSRRKRKSFKGGDWDDFPHSIWDLFEFVDESSSSEEVHNDFFRRPGRAIEATKQNNKRLHDQ